MDDTKNDDEKQTQSISNVTYYAVALPHKYLHDETLEIPTSNDRVLTDLKEASKLLKTYKGSRMKSFGTRESAQQFVEDSDVDDATLNDSMLNLSNSFGSLSTSSPLASNQPGDNKNESIGQTSNISTPTTTSTTPTATPTTSTPTTPTRNDESQAFNGVQKNTPLTNRLSSGPLVFSPSIEQERLFPSAKNEELSKLKRAIERGQESDVRDMIENNPRLLITVCDTPVILMAGPRYNACHIAARSNQAEILNLILETLADVDYVQRLYPTDPIQRTLDCQKFVIDLYLNTPDKVLGNTPLHFACKLGHDSVVRVLLANKNCDIDKVDRQGHTARQCIGERVSGTPKEKEKIYERIRHLFQTRQLLRRERADQRERAASESPQSLDRSFKSRGDSMERLLSLSFDRLNLSNLSNLSS